MINGCGSTSFSAVSGAAGALMDEYDKAVRELLDVCLKMDKRLLDKVVWEPPLQTAGLVLAHVCRAMVCYANDIRKHLGMKQMELPDFKECSLQEYQHYLLMGLEYTLDIFQQNPELELEQTDPEKKLMTCWGQHYDVEQLMEHAIVHVLRHRRQIARIIESGLLV